MTVMATDPNSTNTDDAEFAAFANALGMKTAPYTPGQWDTFHWENVQVGWQVRLDDQEWTLCNWSGCVDNMTLDLRREDEKGDIVRHLLTGVQHWTLVTAREGHQSATDSRWW